MLKDAASAGVAYHPANTEPSRDGIGRPVYSAPWVCSAGASEMLSPAKLTAHACGSSVDARSCSEGVRGVGVEVGVGFGVGPAVEAGETDGAAEASGVFDDAITTMPAAVPATMISAAKRAEKKRRRRTRRERRRRVGAEPSEVMAARTPCS